MYRGPFRAAAADDGAAPQERAARVASAAAAAEDEGPFEPDRRCLDGVIAYVARTGYALDAGMAFGVNSVAWRRDVELRYVMVEQHLRHGRTRLHWASEKGYLPRVKELLEYIGGMVYGDVDAEDERGCTALHFACVKGHLGVAHELMRCGAKVRHARADGLTPLHEAALGDHDDVVRFLLESGADIRTADTTGNTALHTAAHNGQSKAMRELVKHADLATVSLRNANGKTAFELAWSKEVKAWLQLASIAVDTIFSEDGETQLHRAAALNLLEVARELVRRGAKVGAKSRIGNTPLHDACAYGHAETSRFLIDSGADVRDITVENGGATPMSLALQEDRVDVVALLISCGVDVNAPFYAEGWLPLGYASFKGFAPIVRMLLTSGASIQARDSDFDFTALHWASLGKHVEVVRVLLAAGAEIDARCSSRYDVTPLLCACNHTGESSSIDMIRVLIAAGANVRARTGSGSTALHLASMCGDDKSVQELLLHADAALLSLRNYRGFTALDYAPTAEIRAWIELASPGSIEDADEDGATQLHRASAGGVAEAVRELLRRGAWIGARAKNGCTPLHDASFGGCVEVVRVLMAAGADAEARNSGGRSALDVASSESVRRALRREPPGVDPDGYEFE